MRYLSPFLAVLALSCTSSEGKPEPDVERMLRIARLVGDVGLNQYLVPELKSKAPELLIVLDANNDGLLSVSEFDSLPNLTEAEQDALLVRMLLIFSRKQ